VSVTTTIVADGVKVAAELRPNVIPNGGIEYAIVDEHDGLRSGTAFFVIDFSILDVKKRARN
jgi:hypothetical protein